MAGGFGIFGKEFQEAKKLVESGTLMFRRVPVVEYPKEELLLILAWVCRRQDDRLGNDLFAPPEPEPPQRPRNYCSECGCAPGWTESCETCKDERFKLAQQDPAQREDRL